MKTWKGLLPVILGLLLMNSAYSQFVQQGSKLVGTGAVGSAYQGQSVSLSADGNTAIVCGYYDNSGAGAAWVYTRSGGGWSQQGSKLVGTGAVGSAFQGYSVALSADGNTAIVGGCYDSSFAGAVWVFTRSGSTWTQQGNKLVGTGAVGNAFQGYSVALSADGNTALAGGYWDNSDAGAAWVFTRSGSTWTQQGSKLVGTGAVGNALQGYSVALSADGNTAIVGGYWDNSNAGASWVFTRSGSTWTQQGSKLVGAGAVGKSDQGYSVALSADGNTAVIGGPYDNSNTGAAWVFTRSGSTWTQQGNKLLGTGAVGSAQQGISVSLSTDGNTAVIGGPYDNSNTGAAWVFTRSGSTWTQQGNKLLGTGAVGVANQGYSVALSADGNTAVVGGCYDNSSAGAAWVYTGPRPTIAHVADVPSDQGGKVLVMWLRSGYDVFPQEVLTSYGVYRGAKASALPKVTDLHSFPMITHDRITGEPIYWEHYADVTPQWLDAYSLPVETLSDSTAYGNPEYYFMVTVTDSSPMAFWESPPDSGYSVDNLPPDPPASFSGSVVSGQVDLRWKKNSEPDMWKYEVYRSSSPITHCDESMFLSDVSDTAFTDPNPMKSCMSYYVVCAEDIHGNSSNVSSQIHFIPQDFGLAVALTSFTVEPGDYGVSLKWKTGSEVNNSGFIVLRESENETSFKEISSYKTNSALRGLGTSTLGQSYTFTDNTVMTTGKYTYQLESVTISGRVDKYMEVTVDVSMPKDFTLCQNYPNPFNPTTTIRYTLPTAQHVKIEVTNAVGQVVAVLVDEDESAGYKSTVFESSNHSSGVYFYRIQAGSFTSVKKMLLMK
ncbi:MAG TPA: T9SS type A sorting domain-containing protein [Candidatus Kryptonia bacterium]